MGQVLHGSATTTHVVRAVIPRSTASIQTLSTRYGMNPKTVGPSPPFDGPFSGGRSAHGGLSAAHAAAARRLPLRAAGGDPASDTVVAAPLPCLVSPQPTGQPQDSCSLIYMIVISPHFGRADGAIRPQTTRSRGPSPLFSFGMALLSFGSMLLSFGSTLPSLGRTLLGFARTLLTFGGTLLGFASTLL